MLEDVRGEPYGFALAADYCAQHEWGIGGIERTIGARVGDRPLGLPSRTGVPPFVDRVFTGVAEVRRPPPRGSRSRKVPAAVPCRAFGIHRHGEIVGAGGLVELATELLPPPDRGQVGGCWDEDGFCIVAYDERHGAALHALSEAAMAGRLAAWVGGTGGNPFGRGGLVVVDPTRVPAARAGEMLAFDTGRNALLDAALATGIEARLDADQSAGGDDRFRALFPHRLARFALTPRWVKGTDREGDTSHPVMFWLNPANQESSRPGWYTVEELDAWRGGEGPVVNKSRGKARAAREG